MVENQIECPNCGATLPASQLGKIECTYCGSTFSNPLHDKDDEVLIKNIIPFDNKTQRDSVKEYLLQHLLYKDSVPQDIFEHLKLLPIEQYYLPMYLLDGEYRAEWSCTIVYSHTDRQGNEHVDYRPTSGVVTGDFTFLALANGGNELPVGMLPLVKYWFYGTSDDSAKTDDNIQSYFVGEDGNTIKVIPQDISAQEALNYLDTPIRIEAQSAAGSQTTGWEKIKDMRVSHQYRGHSRELLLFPIWYGGYEYKGEKYYYVMKGNVPVVYSSDPREKHSFSQAAIMQIVLGIVLFILLGLGGIIWVIIEDMLSGIVFIAISIFIYLFLCLRYTNEEEKSSEAYKLHKQIGKAKFCNENVPNDSSSKLNNILQYRERNKKLTRFLILLVFIIGIVRIAFDVCVGIVKKQNEREWQEMKQLRLQQAQQRFDQTVAWVSSPTSFFYTQKKQCGHLRQDIRQHLLDLGFNKMDKSSNHDHHHQEGEEVYVLSSPISYEKIEIILNSFPSYLLYDKQEYINTNDDIQDVNIYMLGIDDYQEKFKAALTQYGFSLLPDPPIFGPVVDDSDFNFQLQARHSDIYIRTKTTLPEKYMWNRRKYSNYDIVEFDILQGLRLYSKNEIQEVLDTQNNTMAVGDSIDNDSLVIGL